MSLENGVARLSQFGLFAGMSEADLILASNWIEEKSFSVGSSPYRQGEIPDYLYLVESGQIEEVGLDTATQVVLRRQAEPGDILGRQSALENVPHQTTATVLEDAKLLAVGTGNLRSLLSTLPSLRDRLHRTEVVNRMMAMPLFSSFDRAKLSQIADLVRVVEYPAKQMIYRSGELASAMYVIDTGQVVETLGDLSSAETWARYRAAGSWFGQEELKSNGQYKTTAFASTDVVLFRINRQDLDWLRKLQPQLSQALNPPHLADWLAKTELFAKLSDLEREHLAGFAGLAHYAPGEAIFRQGEKDKTLYILCEGAAIARKLDPEHGEESRNHLYPWAEYGERSAFLGEPHSMTVEAFTPNTWLYMHHDDIERYLTRHPEVRSKLSLKPVIEVRRQFKRLKWMDPDEQLLLRERRHWAIILGRLVAPGVLALVGLVILALLTKGERGLFRALDIAAIALALLWLAWNLIDWLNDYFMVTTKRVAQRERVLFIRETRNEAPLDKVQNVNIDQHFWGNMLGFGSLVIDTAATYGGGRVKFDYLSNPAEVQRLVFEEMGRVRASEQLEARQAIRDKLAIRLGVTFQPRIPPVATAPLATSAPLTGASLLERLSRLPRWQPVWTERKTPDEVTWRKHPIRLLARVWAPALGIIVVLVAAAALLLSSDVSSSLPLLVGSAVILLPLFFWFWWGYENWGNDQYIVTNDRLIDVEKLPLGFRSKRTETTFDKVQNVNYTIPNPLATILRYGTVIIQTAGPEGRLTFEWVVHPKTVQAEIFRRLGAYNENRRRQDLDRRTADLPDWFASYGDLTRNRP